MTDSPGSRPRSHRAGREPSPDVPPGALADAQPGLAVRPGPDRRARRRRWLTRLGTAVAVLVTLVAGQAILRTEPDYFETRAPFHVKGEPGEQVTAGGLLVTLLGVRGAAKAGPPDGLATDTGGVWVIVKVRVEATAKTLTARHISVADGRHRLFMLSGRFRQTLDELELQPGIAMESEVAFEVPRDAATSLTLRVGETSTSVFNGELSAYTDIRVPVREADVMDWLADTEPAEVAQPKVAS